MGFSRQEYWSGLPFPPPGSSDYLSFEYFLSNSTKSSHKRRFLKQYWKETLGNQNTRPPDLPEQVWILKYEWAQRAKAILTTEGHVFHVQPKLIVGKGKVHTCPWMGHASQWESTHTDQRAASADLISDWKAIKATCPAFWLTGRRKPNQHQTVWPQPGMGARGFTWDPSYQIWKLSHLLSLLAEQKGARTQGGKKVEPEVVQTPLP